MAVRAASSESGSAAIQPFNSAFTTSGANACPCSLLETTAQPALSDSGDGSAVTLGLKFNASVDGQVTGVRYFRDAANTGTHVGKLFDTSGSLLASVTIPTQPAGWQSATFSTPVYVTADTTYVVAYFAPNGHYSFSSNYFADPVVNLPLRSVGAGSVYGDGDAFPTRSYLNANYYVDAIFLTGSDDPPAVTTATPADEATRVEVDSLVKAKFDRAIDSESLSVALRGPGTDPVSGTVTYSAGNKTAIFTPASDLAPGVNYTAEVSASSASGVSMAAPKTWTFTTVPPPPSGAAYRLFANNSTPAVPAWDDPDAVSVGMRFSSSADGTLTAIKFYAGPGNSGPHVVTLWSSDGTALGTGTSNSSETGWRTVTLTTPVPITAGETYTASYRAPSGRYAVTPGSFAEPYVNGPLSVPAGGAVYRYSNGFPSASSNANYWVDVVVVI